PQLLHLFRDQGAGRGRLGLGGRRRRRLVADRLLWGGLLAGPAVGRVLVPAVVAPRQGGQPRQPVAVAEGSLGGIRVGDGVGHVSPPLGVRAGGAGGFAGPCGGGLLDLYLANFLRGGAGGFPPPPANEPEDRHARRLRTDPAAAATGRRGLPRAAARAGHD